MGCESFLFLGSVVVSDANSKQKECAEWEEKGVVDSNGKKVKWKQATLKTRKSIGSVSRNRGRG